MIEVRTSSLRDGRVGEMSYEVLPGWRRDQYKISLHTQVLLSMNDRGMYQFSRYGRVWEIGYGSESCHAGKPIPGDLCRISLHNQVLLSMNDRGMYQFSGDQEGWGDGSKRPVQDFINIYSSSNVYE